VALATAHSVDGELVTGTERNTGAAPGYSGNPLVIVTREDTPTAMVPPPDGGGCSITSPPGGTTVTDTATVPTVTAVKLSIYLALRMVGPRAQVRLRGERQEARS
jgi:hypothetical protein